ncbi:MAG: rod-binding protein [Aquamicrobium sp.]|uniref:rod-binding protein n=1 Tax=Aquamicrobium sp. TaxID=1872579 RepID=UPI00349E6A34|nr:rod-binding protein [Aquamicrobium sp.]
MAIATAGDLILDVVRAADPAAAEAARAKLASLSARTEGVKFDPAAAGADAPRGKAATPEAFARFEAMVLQSFIQTMLPADTESVYGGGMAGEMWQSMLAEQLGTTIARRGGIGIAERVLRDHYVADEQKVPVQGVSADPGRPALDEQRLLSTALIHEIQRRVADTLDQWQPSSSDTETR